jgi:Tfp pilus assembly protein PilO
MNVVKKMFIAIFISFICGFFICAGLGYYFFYRPSIDRIEQFRTESNALKELNNREREYNIRERQIIESNDTSIQKLRNILLVIKEREQNK